MLGSAVAVSLIGFQFARRMKRPWFEAEFPALPKKSVDRPLFIGAFIFGIGWGLAIVPARRLPDWHWATMRYPSFWVPCLSAGSCNNGGHDAGKTGNRRRCPSKLEYEARV